MGATGSEVRRSPAEVRNVLFCGSGASGKTTLSERLLFLTGAIKRMGSVEEGSTVSDWTPEEKAHRHSLQPSFMHFEFEGHEVHLIDTPGRADFIGHAIACFPAVESVAIVLDATRGVETTARRLMGVAEERKLPRMIIVNKIDEASDLPGLVDSIRAAFGNHCLPINLPKLKGRTVVNVFEHDGRDEAGDQTDFLSVHEAHKQIVEQVVEVDEELTLEYLEKGDGGFDPQKLHAAFEKALEDGHLVPICFCSAKTGAGCEDLLHVLASLCPSPVEVNPPEFVMRASPEGEESEWHAKPDPAGKVLCHVFKVASDPFIGRMGVFRVHQGTLRQRGEVFIDDQKKAVKISHLFKLQGQEHIEVAEVGPGEIAAVSKIEEIHLNATLHDSHDLDSVRLIPLPIPRPMYGLAIELKNHADETKFAAATQKLAAEDPCFVVERIAATGQTVMRGLGELHLRVMIEKYKNQFGIEFNTSQPKVAYKETISAHADGHHRHKKQTGGAGQFGEVYLRVEPLDNGHPEGFEFATEVVGGTVPRQFWPAVEKGVRQVVQEGAVAGYPMTGIRCVLYDGKYHDVDSKEIAFITAGRRAFIDAVHKARPKLLEPYVILEITAPSRYMGDIAGHLSTKRGRVQDSQVVAGDACVVRAVAPASELTNYANELKSMTGGAGSFSMDYSHDEPTPPQLQAQVISAYKPHAEE